MTKDPVCGMMVDEESTAGHVQYLGMDYYFCSEECQHKFVSSPQDYVKAEPVLPLHTPSALDTLYVCPKHAEVLAPGPGTCPICGTTLELLAPLIPEESGTDYVCPRHRHIVRSEPCACPICGMSLVPRY